MSLILLSNPFAFHDANDSGSDASSTVNASVIAMSSRSSALASDVDASPMSSLIDARGEVSSLFDGVSRVMTLYGAFMALVERNAVPDVVLRAGIRRNLRVKCLKTFANVEDELRCEQDFIEDLRRRETIAIETDKANEQHYEVPTSFYELCLGSKKKYSCCLYEDARTTLDDAETAMLEKYCERGELKDGMAVLELGCGWGSLSLYLAEKYPKSKICGVSNSKTQKEFIDGEAAKRGLTNLEIVTRDVNKFEPPGGLGSYDRIVSIEMFEHMKNYDTLFQRCETWLKPGGCMFVHIFCHKTYPFHYDVEDESDWMSKYFFTGGTMPTDRMFAYFARKLHLKRQWRVNGKHYSRTCEDWLRNLDKNYKKAAPILDETYGKQNRTKWYVYWRLFFLSCSELFNYNDGNEWYVGHYLFEKLA